MTDLPPPTAAPAPAAVEAAPGPGAKPAGKRRRLPFSHVEVLTLLLAINTIAIVGLGVRVYRGDKPTVVTVGITQMSREYMARLATAPNVTPQEASIRTRLYLAVAQEAVKDAATKKGILVLPRECVLAGEYSDVTADVSKAVNAMMETRLRATPVAGPLLPQASLEGEGRALR